MEICLGFFYTDDGIIDAWDLEWLQNALDVISSLFQRYGLV